MQDHSTALPSEKNITPVPKNNMPRIRIVHYFVPKFDE
jgi:hypothetical protein